MAVRARVIAFVGLAAAAGAIFLALGSSRSPRGTSEIPEIAKPGDVSGPAPPSRPRESEGSPPASQTPPRQPGSPAGRSPATPTVPAGYSERIRGRLVMRDSGAPPPGRATVTITTGKMEIDAAVAIARLGGGPEGLERIRKLSQRESMAMWDALRGRSTFLVADAREDGSFEMAAPPDVPPLRVTVEADLAFLPERGRTYTLDEARSGLALELLPGANVEVAVLDPAGAPVPKARVSIVERSATASWGTFDVTGSDGRCLRRGARPGRLEVVAVAEGWSPSTLTSVDLSAGETRKVDLTLAPESYVTGRVVDEDGNGIAGAGVTPRLDPRNDSQRANLLESTRTGSDGAFRLGSLPSGACVLSASLEGRLPGEETRVEVPPGKGVEGVRLLLRTGNVVAGRVLDGNRQPAAGIDVSVETDVEAYETKNRRRPERPSYVRVETSVDGAFRASGLANPPFRVMASHRTGGTAEAQGVEAGNTDLLLVLGTPTGYAGRVVDGETGAAVTRFRIDSMRWVEGSPGGKSGGPGTPVDSTDGAFEILGVRPGLHEVSFVADGFAPATIDKVEVTPGSVHRGLEVRLVRTATARGRVVEAESGTPVPGAAVTATNTDLSFLRFSRPGTATPGNGWAREDGTFEVLGIVPGTVTLRAQREGFVEGKSEPVDAKPGAVVDGIAIALSRGGGLDGFAFGRDGKPLSGRRVTATPAGSHGGWQRQASTEESGYFRIEALAPGEYRVEAHPPGGDPHEASVLSLRARMIVEAGKVVRVDFTPPAGTCTVRGTVRRGTEPFAKAEVWSSPEGSSGDGNLLPRSVSDDSGAFELSGVQPGWTLFQVRTFRDFSSGISQFRLLVPDQREFTADLVLPGGEILGRIVRASDGSPVPGAEVSARPLLSRPRTVTGGRATAEEDGSFRLRGLELGEYDVHASHREGRFAPSGKVRVEVGENAPARIELALPDPGSISVTVLGPDGRPPSEAMVWFQRVGESGASREQTDFRGRVRKTGFGAGTYVVWVSSPVLAPGHSGEISVEHGRETECTVRLERGVEVRIRATGPEGRVPLDESRVRVVGDREFAYFARPRLAPLPAGQDATGTVRLLLAPGEYRLIVEYPTYPKREQAFVVGTNSAQEVTVVLSK